MRDCQEARAGVEESLLALAAFVRVDRVLSGQIPAARREFFGRDLSAERTAERANGRAAQRFLEWFALERRAEGCGGPPVASFVAAGCPGLAPALRPTAARLLASRCGVFAVRDEDGSELEVEDAGSGQRLRVWLPAESGQAAVGDTLIGRLLRTADEDEPDAAWIASGACEVVSGSGLFDAFAQEVEDLRLTSGREDEVPISQLALEKILRAAGEAEGESIEAIEREVEALLGQAPAGLLPSVAEISEQLAAAAAPGGVLGPLLERIAFETELDLDDMQRLLLRLWNAHQRPARKRAVAPPVADLPPAAPARSGDLGRDVAAELEAGLAAGEDLEHLFDRLESMADAAGASSAGVGEPEELRWHTEDEGNADALLAEYLWERERNAEPVPAADRTWLERFVASWRQAGVRDVEQVESAHVLAPLVEPWSRGEPESCLAGLSALRDWCGWLAGEQGLALPANAASLFDELGGDRRRWRELETQWRDHGPASVSPQPWHVLPHASGADWELEVSNRALTLPGHLPLRAGDVILGCGDADGFAPGFRMLPPLLAAVVPGKPDRR